MDAYEALVTRVSPAEICDPAPDEETERKIIAAALRAPHQAGCAPGASFRPRRRPRAGWRRLRHRT